MSLDSNTRDSRLSAISTNWDDIIAARDDSTGSVRNQILVRYSSCVYRYILSAARNADAADDLSQEFALRFVRGDYKNADPSKGRFRDYLRASLRNLITDQFRKKKEAAHNVSVAEQLSDIHVDRQLADLERDFHVNWREHVLGLAWKALRESDSGRSSNYYAVLHFRSLHPEAKSIEMAKALSVQLGKPVSSDWVRQKLKRARQKFADLLTMEVRNSLSDKTEESVREELAVLGLLKYLER